MRLARHSAVRRQRGLVLISSLLLLLVVTLLALAMFRSMGIDARIAGNVREKERALHAAENAQQYAEWWLSNNSASVAAPTACTAVLNANLGQGQICANSFELLNLNPATVPWMIGGVPVGVTYTPPNMNATGVTPAGQSAANTYVQPPTFYIAYVGPAADGSGGLIYQIDAVGYGGTANTVAVVESTYELSSGVTNRGGL